MQHFERIRGSYVLSSNPGRMDIAAIHNFLKSSYWSKDIPREIVERAVTNSLSFGIFHENEQIGFARVITDKATFAYLCDVYVLESYRGQGLGSWLMESVMQHPEMQSLRRFGLVTKDAHELYRRFGFSELKNPAGHMEIHHPDIYCSHKLLDGKG